MRAWRLRRLFVVGAAVVAVVMTLAAAVVLVSYVRLIDDERRVTETLFPSVTLVNALGTATAAQETGLQAYSIHGDDASLQRYLDGRSDEAALAADLKEQLTGESPQLVTRVDDLTAATETWRREHADVVVERIRADGPGSVRNAELRAGREQLAAVRQAHRALDDAVRAERAAAIDLLKTDRERMGLVFVLGLVLLVLALGALYLVLTRWVLRPLEQVASEALTVASGELEHEVRVDGPPEVVALAQDVDTMRRRILAQLHEASDARRSLEEQRAVLARQTAELQRSNAELEQFAYVASHDLQEPLRKVASFTQLLEQRYGERLDDRAHQYIAFAADGARRMQQLVTDLLTFSRVSNDPAGSAEVDLGLVLKDALHALAARVETTDAVITHDPLPTVLGEHGLLVQLFQNLVGNSLKFHAPGEPPRVHVAARPVADGAEWELSVADEGIGVDPVFAERVFAIFQRLNRREDFDGTGIGLALCRKIVERHGGRLWLDTGTDTDADGPVEVGREPVRGATFRFTLPAPGREHLTGEGAS